MAKLIIGLIGAVASVINNDPIVGEKLKVLVFSFCYSLLLPGTSALRTIPAYFQFPLDYSFWAELVKGSCRLVDLKVKCVVHARV